jgi:hypothetical protein
VALCRFSVPLSHTGQRYGDRFDIVLRREAGAPNALWQASDHTELDLLALRNDGRPDRSWLTVISDDHSRAIAGFAFSFDAPSALRTSLALRQAIWRKPAKAIRTGSPCWASDRFRASAPEPGRLTASTAQQHRRPRSGPQRPAASARPFVTQKQPILNHALHRVAQQTPIPVGGRFISSRKDWTSDPALENSAGAMLDL